MSDFYDIKDLQKSSYFDLITSTPDSRFNKLVRQGPLVCYIIYFSKSNIEKKHVF